jgi:hypothetical protein
VLKQPNVLQPLHFGVPQLCGPKWRYQDLSRLYEEHLVSDPFISLIEDGT